ncbi:MAG: adenylate/guanylate cyclase domain-containing protein, partial [Bacteroidota bacterium]
EMRTWQVNGVFFGIVFIQAIFFLFLYVTTRTRYYLYYVIFLIGLALIMIVTNYLFFILPAYYEFMLILNIILGSILTIGLLYFAFDFLRVEERSKKWKYFLQGFIFIFLGANLVLLWKIIKSSEYYFENRAYAPVENNVSFSTSLALIGLMAMVYWAFTAHRKGHKTARYLLIGMGIMLFGIGIPLLSPILQNDWVSFDDAILSSQISIIILLAFFALALGQQRRQLEADKRNALEEKLKLQEEINAASAKFVPFDFIRSLGKQNILDVRLGDATEKEVTVFFSDIRDYTSLVEHMSPEENFRFINDFHRTIGPNISHHKGFVSQYLGDGIMAVFLESQDHALQAAIDIQSQIREYTPLIPDRQNVSLRLGMGLHAGNLMMGIIGDDKRTDAATVSDTVNTASRMEGLTKYYGAPILLSGEVKERLENEEAYALRYLGKVQVKGKQNHVEVYESLKGRSEAEQEVFVRFMQEFQSGVNAYFSKDFKEARDAFEKIISFNSSDKAAQLFYQNSLAIIKDGMPENWDGSLRMQGK